MKKRIAAILALTSAFALAQKGTGPIIHYKYPAGYATVGGPSEKNIDCGTMFFLAADSKTPWATCNFLEQVDNNNQEICSVTDRMLSDEASQKAALSTALLAGLRHYALAHHSCLKQAGNVEMKLGKTAEQVGEMFKDRNWQNQTYCPIVEVTNACKAAMGIRAQLESPGNENPYEIFIPQDALMAKRETQVFLAQNNLPSEMAYFVEIGRLLEKGFKNIEFAPANGPGIHMSAPQLARTIR